MACTENPASQNVADFIYPYYFFDFEQILSLGEGCYDFAGRDYVILHKPLNEVLPLSIEKEGYDVIPNLYALLDASSMESIGIRKVFEQPSLGNKGRGTILGIIDTGIDYRSPLFRNPDGTTRILGIWDQTIEGDGLTDVPPYDAIHYGTFYTEAQINDALQSPDPLALVPTIDDNGHGTQMAAIAAGSDTAIPDFLGAAPEAKLVIVRLKQAKQYLRDFYLIPSSVPAFQENDIMVGVKYLLYIARNYQMPLTILLGLGTNAGSHEGALPLASYLTRLSSVSGLIIVVAGGNETGRGHHYLGQISPGEAYEDVEVRVGPEENGFTLELWAMESELYSVGFFSPAGEEIARLPAALSQEQRITFLLSDTVIHVTYSYSQAVTGSQLILMRFEKPTTGIWRIRVFNAISLQGNFHMWLPVNDFISENTYFLRSNPDTLITDPGNAAPIITTAAYNHRTGGIYIHSSRGYSRTGAVKPDLAAPGVDITGSSGQTITGTSIAAAHMAGACASLLAWASAEEHISYFNTPVAKALLIRGAGRRAGLEYPNREWGYGTLNLYDAFLAVRG